MLYLFIGSTLLCYLLHDFFSTIISMNGAGPISNRIVKIPAKILLKLSIQNRKILAWAGYISMVLLIIWWVFGFWLSIFILLLTDTASVLHSSTNLPADAWGKLYYAGYTFSTLGNGSYIPGSTAWRIVTALSSILGFIVITGAITYTISIAGAVTSKRTLSNLLHDLIIQPEEEGFVQFLQDASFQIQEMLNKHTQNHQAFPVVHYYFSEKPENSFLLNFYQFEKRLINLSRNQQYFMKGILASTQRFFNIIILTEGKEINMDNICLRDREKLYQLLLSTAGWSLDEHLETPHNYDKIR